MRILGIETSCDETAIAVLEVTSRRIQPIRLTRDKQTHRSEKIEPQARGEVITVLSNVISSQVKLHAKYGGIVPNLAAREHVKNIEHVFELALKKAAKSRGWKIESGKLPIDLIAVTRGPGLGPSLLVGISFARTLAWKYDKPLVGVNHLEGHIYSNWLKPVGEFSIFAPSPKRLWRVGDNFQFSKKVFPILNLIVSGGHTELVIMTGHGKYKIIGETLDDAAGEAFDKVARLLGLGYPGGPQIAQHAERFAQNYVERTQTNTEKWIPHKSVLSRHESVPIKFPRPMINSKNYDFSYAGLKTSVLYKVRDLKSTGVKLTDGIINEICCEFQNAALDVLVEKAAKAIKEYKIRSLFLSGGVSANKELRKRLEIKAKKLKIDYSQPEMEYTGDNAAMIAMAGYMNYQIKENKKNFTWKSLEMDANLSF